MTQHPLVLALDVAGNPFKWIDYEEATLAYCKDLVAWDLGNDEHFTIHGGIQKATGNQSKLKVSSIIAIKGLKISNVRSYNTPPLTNKSLFKRDHNLCAYCGEQYAFPILTRDHVKPRAQGGADVWTNVVTACGPCNRHKDDRTPEEAGMELLYVPYVPNRCCYLILQNKNILQCQMDFLQSKSNFKQHPLKKN